MISAIEAQSRNIDGRPVTIGSLLLTPITTDPINNVTAIGAVIGLKAKARMRGPEDWKTNPTKPGKSIQTPSHQILRE
jgi:hypothetical protein